MRDSSLQGGPKKKHSRVITGRLPVKFVLNLLYTLHHHRHHVRIFNVAKRTEVITVDM